MSDETVRTIWVGVAGFIAYVIGFAQALFMVWWKASSDGRRAKLVRQTMLKGQPVRPTVSTS